MAEEKIIISDEQLTDEQLEEVAGGKYKESYDDMMKLYCQFGINFYSNNRDASVNKLAAIYQRAGTRLDAHNSDEHSNRYFDGYGRPVTHQTAINDLVYKIRAGIINVNDLRY